MITWDLQEENRLFRFSTQTFLDLGFLKDLVEQYATAMLVSGYGRAVVFKGVKPRLHGNWFLLYDSVIY